MNLTKFSKAKCRALHLDLGKPKQNYRLSAEETEQPCREKPGVFGALKSKHELAMSACSSESPSNPGLLQMKYGQQITGDSLPLFLSHKAHVEYCVQLWVLQQKNRHKPVRGRPEKGHRDDHRAGACFL